MSILIMNGWSGFIRMRFPDSLYELGRKAYGSYEETLEESGVELVYVASPHSHRYQHTKMCLEHGKHVLVKLMDEIRAMWGMKYPGE